MSVRRRPTVRLFAEVLEDRSTPATLTVTTTADSGVGSLRAAITQANADPTPDTIVFAPDLALRTIFLSTVGDTSIGPSALFVTGPVTVQGTGQSIALAGGVPAMRLFAVAPSGNLTLDGVTLFGGIAQGGAGAGLSGGGAGLGGAIYNQGTLQIYNSALIGNKAIGGNGGNDSSTAGGAGGLGGAGNADGSGGGPNGGTAGGGNGGFGGGGGAGTAGTSTTNGGPGGAGGFGGGGGQGGNGGTGTTAGTGGAGGFGGGGGGNSDLTGSAKSGAGGFSGGPGQTGEEIPILGGRESISPGHGGGGGGMGGAIFNQGGTVTIANTTITGNAAVGGSAFTGGTGGAFGGGLFNLNGTATLTNVTLARNTVAGGDGTSQGGEVYNLSYDVGSVTSGQTATLILANDILADTFSNAAPRTVGGSDLVNNQVNGTATINATGPNLLSTAVVSTNLATSVSGTPFTVADPNLGPLTGNGGQTQTMLPRAGSPALGAGSTAALTAANFGGTAPTTDQRGTGFPRTVNGKVDLGAAEVQPGGTVATAPSLVVSGIPTGPAEVFAQGSNGQYSSSPAATLTPFPGFAGEVRTAVGDVNGDGIPDTILVTGPGAPIQFAVISGADNTTVLVPPTSPFAGSEGFTGGGFVAAGDFAHIGRADIVVTPDQGGGPRVAIFAFLPTGLTQVANFFGINDPNFRGGARPAVGDVNRDGTPDLAVAAGFGGGPRVALYNGNTVLSGTPTELVNDFFAFPGTDATTLRNGVYVAVGDVNGDGFGDLIFGGGPGGAPRLFILSGMEVLQGGDLTNAYGIPVANFFVNGNSSDRGGVRVAAVNADGDDQADVAVGSGAGDPANVRVYLGKNFSGGGEPGTFQDLTVFGGTTLADGVYVG